MHINFSVIIPAHNRSPQLLLTLAAFNVQINSIGSYEIIVVDDGSTDDTKEVVQNFAATYPLTYTHLESNTGRSCARNRGISLAKGRYLIFCDSDFIVIPTFIQILHDYHLRYSKAVISGVPHSWNTAYTHYYPNFPSEQKKDMYTTLNHLGLWSDSFWGEEKKIVPVLKPEDIYNDVKKIEKLIPPWALKMDSKNQEQLTDVAPWLLFVTRCVSVKKEFVERVGGFDEIFLKYGMEDWELGYRLHQLGLSFISIEQTIGYHQEHPRDWAEPDASLNNLRIMYNKFGFSDPALTLFAVFPPWKKMSKYLGNLAKLKKYKKQGRDDKAVRLEKEWKRKAIAFYENK